jgi:phage/plasmid-associated DNA primase
MDSVLRKFIRANRATGTKYTHVSLIEPKGRYNFSRYEFASLWELYCGKISTEWDSFISGLAEKPQKFVPVMADVDIKVKMDNPDIITHVYTQEHLRKTIKVYQKVIKEVVYNYTDDHLTCLVLEKDPYKKSSNTISSGFHLHFPRLFLDKLDQEIHIISRVRRYIEEENVFSGLQLIGEPIDKAACKNTWMLYGSTKNEKMDPYKVTTAFDYQMEEVPLHQALYDYKLYDAAEEEIKLDRDIEYYLPQILSIFPFGRKTSIVKQDLSFLQKEVLLRVRDLPEKHREEDVSQSLADAQKILSIISDDRAYDHGDWLKIGFTLYNIGEGCEEALDLWVEFSERCPEKFSESVCVYTWGKMKLSKYSIGTLKYYASIDHPNEYKQFIDVKSMKSAKESLDGCHYDIAKVMFVEYGNMHVFTGGKEKMWYRFHDGIWRRDDKGHALRSTISREIARRYQKTAMAMCQELAHASQLDEKSIQARIKQANKIVCNLKTTTYKNNVMRECEEVFYREGFIEKLDTNKYLIAVTNGVYDLKKHKCRPGIPDDYLSACIPHKYVEYNTDDEEIEKVMSFLEKVFPDKTLLTYFLDETSDLFLGGNPRKIISVWSGDGDNGKSITDKLVELVLGKRYNVKVPTSLITGKRTQSSQACPELARAGNGVRRIVAQEPNRGAQANVGLLKELSGNDSFFVRGLYSDGADIDPLFMLTIVCNDLPRLSADDPALWNRLRVLLFESNFCDKYPESYEEQLKTKTFPKDPYFADKLPEMCSPFLWLLLNHRKECVMSNRIRIDPKKVCSATATYRRSNDTYRQYIEECLINDGTTVLSLIELFTYFKEWFKTSFPSLQVPPKIEMEHYLVKRWGAMKPGFKWKGHRARTQKDDIAEENILLLAEKDLDIDMESKDDDNDDNDDNDDGFGSLRDDPEDQNDKNDDIKHENNVLQNSQKTEPIESKYNSDENRQKQIEKQKHDKEIYERKLLERQSIQKVEYDYQKAKRKNILTKKSNSNVTTKRIKTLRSRRKPQVDETDWEDV